MDTPRHEDMDASDSVIEDGVNKAMAYLERSVNDGRDINGANTEDDDDNNTQEKDNDHHLGTEAAAEVDKADDVQEVEQNSEGEWQKVHMEYAVKRPQLHLWRHIQGLQAELGCKSFYDLEIFCQDGVVSWNRLLMALSHPHFNFLLHHPFGQDDVMIHLPGTLGEDLLKILQGALEEPPIGQVEVVDPESEVKYTLVQHVWPKDYDYPLVGWDEDEEEYVDNSDGEYQPQGWNVDTEGNPVKMEAKLEPVEVFCSRCEVCDKEFFNDEQLKDHAKVHNPDLIRFTCGIAQCCQGFAIENLYQIHVKMHEKELKDAEIDRKAEEIMIHEQMEGLGMMWRCATCGFHSKLKYTVKTHCETHLINSHECALCNATCSTRNALRTHMYRKHPESILREHRRSTKPKTPKIHDIDFSGSDDEYEPLEYDERAKNWKPNAVKRKSYEKTCEQCNRKFRSKKTWEDHAKVHNPELIKFTCIQCLEGFIVESEYKNHLNIHSVERTRALGPAGIEQELLSLVTTMYDSEINKMLYQCTFCGYKNARKTAVFEHAETHNTNIAHQCPVCKKTCPTKNALRVHLVRKHSTSKLLALNNMPPPEKQRRKRTPMPPHTIYYTPPTPNPNAITYSPSPMSTPNSHYSPSPAPSPAPAYIPRPMLPCPHCHKSSPTKNALRVHIARYHKEEHQAQVKQEYYNQQAAKQGQQPQQQQSHQQQQLHQQQQQQNQYQKAQAISSPKQLALPSPKPPKPPSSMSQFTQLRPPVAHSGPHPAQPQPSPLQTQQALALQAQQNAFPDFFWNKY